MSGLGDSRRHSAQRHRGTERFTESTAAAPTPSPTAGTMFSRTRPPSRSQRTLRAAPGPTGLKSQLSGHSPSAMSHLNPPPPDHPSHTAQALCASVPLCRAVPRPSSLDSRGQDVRGWISTRQDATPLVLTPVVSPTRTTSHTARVDGEATCADSVTRGGTRHRGTERFPRDPVPMNAWFILSNRVLGGRRPDGGWVICARPAAPSPRRHGGTEGHGDGKPRGGPSSASGFEF